MKKEQICTAVVIIHHRLRAPRRVGWISYTQGLLDHFKQAKDDCLFQVAHEYTVTNNSKLVLCYINKCTVAIEMRFPVEASYRHQVKALEPQTIYTNEKTMSSRNVMSL